MKRNLFSVLLVCATTLLSMAQNFIPMPFDTAHYWHEAYTTKRPNGSLYPCEYLRKITKDTLIAGKTYKKMQVVRSTCDPTIVAPENKLFKSAYLRPDAANRCVFILDENYAERILYNFNKSTGDTVSVFDISTEAAFTFSVTEADSILLNDNKYHKRIRFSGGPGEIIEGVGGMFGITQPYRDQFEHINDLLCLGETSAPGNIYGAFGGSECVLTIGVTENAFQRAVVYPNPVSNELVISSNEFINAVRVLNMLGKVEFSSSSFTGNRLVLGLGHLAPGPYIIEVRSASGVTLKKFLRQ